MGYSSKANPFLSRKTYNAICEWWSRTTCKGQLALNKLGYELAPTGTFHAKDVSQFSFNKKNEGDIRLSNSYVTIETPDDISAIMTDDLIRYQGIIYRVDNVTRRQISKTREFMRKPLCVYVMQLTR